MIQEHKIKLIVAAIGFYLLLLVSNLPAAQVLNRITLPDNVHIQGVGGTLWEGNALSVTVDGVQLKNVNWNLSFLSLILGNVAAEVKAGNARDADSIYFNGDVDVALLSLIHI